MSDIGILDPLGKKLNPLTNEKYSDKYKELSKMWSNLPAYKNAKQIIKDIKKHQVLLIVSGTGSGKTVLIPKYMLHVLGYKGKVAVTLPKQIVAKSNAEFASATLDVQLGQQISYKYKGSPKEHYNKNSNILYATDGTIVQKLLNDPVLSEYDAVIIDEAHERKIMIDFLLFLLKQTLKKRPEFKLIIMSATINSKIFKKYYEKFNFKELQISGKPNFPIESIYLDEPIGKNDFVNKGFEIISDLLGQNEDLSQFKIEGNKLKIVEKGDKKSNDILFFVASPNEARQVCAQIANKSFFNKKPICIEVYSGMSRQREELAVDKDKYKELGYTNKIVISTNVAESSLTIDGITYVIDSGYEYNSRYDPDERGKKLVLERTSKAQIRQRMGRAGRTGPGVCYHLYTKDEFEKFKDYGEPSIRTEDITNELLNLLNMDKIETVINLKKVLKNMIEPPKDIYIQVGLDKLNSLNLVKENKLTEKGRIFNQVPGITIYLKNVLFLSYIYNCSHEISLIIGLIEASRINMKNIFNIPNYRMIKDSDKKKKIEQKFNEKKNKFYSVYGDHIAMLNIMTKYKERGDDREQWCKDNYLKYKTLRKALIYAKDMRRNLIRRMNDVDVNKYKKKYKGMDELDKRVIICLIIGLKQKAVLSDTYRTKHAVNVSLNRNSYLIKDKPKYVVYTELTIMDKKELNFVTKISNDLVS